jgi:MSHA biogenesis protein MshK
MVKHTLLALTLLSGFSIGDQALALHDPTRPTDPVLYFGGQRAASTAAWTLQSVLSSPDRRIAIINGTPVREGDRIGAARVVSIQPSRVVLNTGKRNLTLKLWNNKVKKVTP